jgi:hypothetical protein
MMELRLFAWCWSVLTTATFSARSKSINVVELVSKNKRFGAWQLRCLMASKESMKEIFVIETSSVLTFLSLKTAQSN